MEVLATSQDVAAAHLVHLVARFVANVVGTILSLQTLDAGETELRHGLIPDFSCGESRR